MQAELFDNPSKRAKKAADTVNTVELSVVEKFKAPKELILGSAYTDRTYTRKIVPMYYVADSSGVYLKIMEDIPGSIFPKYSIVDINLFLRQILIKKLIIKPK